MRAFYVLFTVVIIFQILDGSMTGASAEEGNEETKVVVRKRTKTRTESSNTESQTGSEPRGLEDKPRTKKKPSTPPPSEEDKEEQPTNLTGAFRNLGRTTVGEVKNRGTDFVNGSTNLVKSLSRKGSAIGGLIGKQRRNGEELIVEGIGMVSEAGDSVARGTRHVMNSAKEVLKEGGNQAHGGLMSATGLAKSSTKMLGSAFNTPVAIAGDWVEVGSNAVNVPKRLSRAVSGQINKRVLRVNDDQENGESGDKGAAEPTPKAKKSAAK